MRAVIGVVMLACMLHVTARAQSLNDYSSDNEGFGGFQTLSWTQEPCTEALACAA